jgi:DNA modification methylase
MIKPVFYGDCRESMKQLISDGVKVQMCVTSPPYWGLRDYGHADQLGLEKTPEEYVTNMVEVFHLVRELLKDDGTLWLNLGDTYSAHKDCKSVPDSLRVGGGSETANIIEKGKSFSRDTKLLKSQGLKNKDLIGIPWSVAFALRADGWYLRQDIIWHKPNPMPESVTDRCTKAHEYIFLMSKNARYYYDQEAIKEPFVDDRMGNPNGGGQYARDAFAYAGPNAQSGLQKGQWNTDNSKTGRNKRSVWTITTKPYSEAHFATFPPDLIIPCILAGSKPGDTVLDPFFGSGTTGEVCIKLGRQYIGCELQENYKALIENRTKQGGLFV